MMISQYLLWLLLERPSDCWCVLLRQEDMKKKAALEEKKDDSTTAEDPKGIPEFWLTIFKHVDMLGEMLQVKALIQSSHKTKIVIDW